MGKKYHHGPRVKLEHNEQSFSTKGQQVKKEVKLEENQIRND